MSCDEQFLAQFTVENLVCCSSFLQFLLERALSLLEDWVCDLSDLYCILTDEWVFEFRLAFLLLIASEPAQFLHLYWSLRLSLVLKLTNLHLLDLRLLVLTLIFTCLFEEQLRHYLFVVILSGYQLCLVFPLFAAILYLIICWSMLFGIPSQTDLKMLGFWGPDYLSLRMTCCFVVIAKKTIFFHAAAITCLDRVIVGLQHKPRWLHHTRCVVILLIFLANVRGS